jgi:hypothetical protein
VLPRSATEARGECDDLLLSRPTGIERADDAARVIAAPLAASAESSPWMSRLAATSTPRVGSSTMAISGSVSSQRASSVFCWLPPESARAGLCGPDALMPSMAIAALASLSLRTPEKNPKRPILPCEAAAMLAASDMSRKRPSVFRSCGT